MGNVWFVSDLHLNHTNIIRYCNRPFESLEHMNHSLVQRWNSVVSHKDTVYCLGDMAFGNYELLDQLHGKKLLVPGNHDLERGAKVLSHFQGVLPELFRLNLGGGLKFILSHYPLESWWRSHIYHLHGHCHGESRTIPNRMDVGVDATRLYRPLHLEEVIGQLQESEDED